MSAHAKRRLDDGAIIWEKDLAGITGFDIAVSAAGLFVATSTNLERRSLTTGDVDLPAVATFASNYGASVAALGDDVYVGGDHHPTAGGTYIQDYEWHLERRSAATGSLAWAKNYDLSHGTGAGFPGIDNISDLGLDASGVYVAGRQNVGGWKVLKVTHASGDITWQTPVYGAQPVRLAVHGQQVVVVGSAPNVGSGQVGWRIQWLDAAAGTEQWARSIDMSGGDLGYNDAALGSPSTAPVPTSEGSRRRTRFRSRFATGWWERGTPPAPRAG